MSLSFHALKFDSQHIPFTKMKYASLISDNYPVVMSFDDNLQNQLIKNAQYFQYTGMMPMLVNIIGPTYDVVTFFETDDGAKYSVIHTVFAEDYKKEFETSIRESTWEVSVCDSKFKRDCIKQYMKDANCDLNRVFCIMNFVDME